MVLASVNILPGETLFTLRTLGSKRSITTANPRRASELSSIASCRFSPTDNSDFAGLRRSSITLGSGPFEAGGTSVAGLLGARSSAGVVTVGALFALSDVVDTAVWGVTTFFNAVATSSGLVVGSGVV